MSTGPIRAAYLGFGVLGAAVLGAFVYERAFPPQPAPALTRAGETPAAAKIEAGTVPAHRPDFTLKDLDGHAKSISAWDGKPLIINFWATWCAPCRREIPLLNRIQREYAPHGFEVVGIAVDFVDDVKAYKKTFPIDYPLLVGEDDGLEAARAFGVQAMAFPFTAFTDTAGRLLLVHMGELHEDQARAILGVVAEVDGGRLAPAAARGAIERALAALPGSAKAAE